ncbi:MAG TPA: hypothetical protein VKZ79_16465 [Alphaproteobacteria bacterium]|nr:hypothetical protein [Alphaproteobacteria bacterium]
MLTLCIRYTFNPDRLADFKTYVEGEQGPIERSGDEPIDHRAHRQH